MFSFVCLWQVSAEKEAMIVNMDMTELQQKLWRGELKALEVLRAYQKKVSRPPDICDVGGSVVRTSEF